MIVTVGHRMTKKNSSMVCKKIKEEVKENKKEKIYAQYNKAQK